MNKRIYYYKVFGTDKHRQYCLNVRGESMKDAEFAFLTKVPATKTGTIYRITKAQFDREVNQK